MVFIFDAKGNLCNSIPENVYEGSNEANTIVVVAPWTSGTQVYMSYQLPNSLYSEPVLLTEFDTSPLPEDLKANAWSIDIDDVITQSSGRVNFQFFAVTAGKILPSASITSGGAIIIDATVNAAIFATKVQSSGQYVFRYSGAEWRLDGNAVNLSDYGITLTSGVPQSGSTLTVTYTAGSVKRQATTIVSVPINKGNEIILPETPSQTIYDQILAALASIQNDIDNGWFESHAILPWDSGFKYKQGDLVYHKGYIWQKNNSYGMSEPSISEDNSSPVDWIRRSVGYRVKTEVGPTVAKSGETFNDYINNTATGDFSHAEGKKTAASGDNSHAGGNSSIASGENAFAHGEGVKATEKNQFVVGSFNNSAKDADAIFIVGNGTTENPATIFKVRKDGTIVATNLSFDGVNVISDVNKEILTGNVKVATVSEFDDLLDMIEANTAALQAKVDKVAKVNTNTYSEITNDIAPNNDPRQTFLTTSQGNSVKIVSIPSKFSLDVITSEGTLAKVEIDENGITLKGNTISLRSSSSNVDAINVNGSGIATREYVQNQIEQITAVQIRNKYPDLVISCTEAEVQTVATQYIVNHYSRQPKSFDGLVITLTDKDNDKVLYTYSEASAAWIDTGMNQIDLANYVDLTSDQEISGKKNYKSGKLLVDGEIVSGMSSLTKIDTNVGQETVLYDTTDGLTVSGTGQITYEEKDTNAAGQEFVNIKTKNINTEFNVPILPGANINIDANEDGTAIVVSSTTAQDYQIVTAEPEDKSQGKMIYEKSSGSDTPFQINNLKIADGNKYNSIKDLVNAGMQEKLTAGTGITIENNVISATAQETQIDNTTITKKADGKLQAVGLQDETDSKTLTAHDIWLACSIEREV